MADQGGGARSMTEIVSLLTEARARTLLLVAPLGDEELVRQHDPIMSPVVWDLGHIAHFEEVWLLRNLEGGAGDGTEGLSGIFNPFENPRQVRGELALPSPAEALTYLARVRRAVLERLTSTTLDHDSPLLREGYVFRMVLQHEYQHGETILQTLQLMQGRPYPAPRALDLPAACDPAARGVERMVRFPGGEVTIGTDDRSAAYDNERRRHPVHLRAFWIDAYPVTNGEFLAFIEDQGYSRRDLWSEEGWSWLGESAVVAPKHWRLQDGVWRQRIMDLEQPVDERLPVCHVCYHEAEAYARWAGKRLPTEEEWEAAASWDPEAGRARSYPWGDRPPTAGNANLDALVCAPAPVGSYPESVSPIGCLGMIGDVWEWTASDFRPYPGFEAFPYPEYSQVFFGAEYKVLRGGSWATRPGAIRNTFRNWDYPIRRQIFAGFRCARDD